MQEVMCKSQQKLGLHIRRYNANPNPNPNPLRLNSAIYNQYIVV